MSKENLLFAGLLACAVAVTASPARAGEFDGSGKLLCVPVDIRQCTAGGDCVRTSADDVNLPQFIRVDFKKKQLSGTDADGEHETTAIQNVEVREGEKTILQGAEGARAWSMVIDQETGKMSASVSDNQVGFLVFGACTSR